MAPRRQVSFWIRGFPLIGLSLLGEAFLLFSAQGSEKVRSRQDGAVVVILDEEDQPFTVRRFESNLWVDIVGRDSLRPGQTGVYTVRLGNAGHQTVKDVGVLLDFGANVDWRIDTRVPGDKVETPALYIHHLDPGQSTSFEVWLTPPLNRGRQIGNILDFSIHLVQAAMDWQLSLEIERDLNKQGQTLSEQNRTLLAQKFELARDRALANVVVSGLTFALGRIGATLISEGIVGLHPYLESAGVALTRNDLLAQIIRGLREQWEHSKDEQSLTEYRKQVEIVRAVDPNLKVGPSGYGDQHFIPVNSPIDYTILFENDPEKATAPAQVVRVRDQLPNSLDWSTFSLGAIFVAGQSIPVPAGRTQFATQIEMDVEPWNGQPEIQRVRLEVDARFDSSTGLAEWTFTARDPETGEIADFLIPNTKPPLGEGWVLYNIYPKAGLPSGTVIRNTATITFDPHFGGGVSLETPEVFHTLDSRAPAAQVAPLERYQLSPTFTISWLGSDEEQGSGIADYAVYVSEDDGPYRLWMTFPEPASSNFTGQFGRTYRFYAVARDRVGHVEPAPDQPHAMTTVGQKATIPVGVSMVSLPIEPEGTDPQEVIGFSSGRWARWNPAAEQYVFYDHDPSRFTWFDPPLAVPGRAYWVKMEAERKILPPGRLVDIRLPKSIPLQKGWNMIGCPFLQPVLWTLDALKVRKGGEERTLDQPQALEWIEDYAWSWETDPKDPLGGRYVPVYDASVLSGINIKSQLEPWKGYWIYASMACDLILPPPGSNQGSARKHGPLNNGWMLRLQAQTPAGTGEVRLGVKGSGRDLVMGLPPDPPTGNNPLRMALLRNGEPLAVDVRRGMDGRQVWDVVVQAEDGIRNPTEVVLTWPDLRGVPGNVSLTLVDAATGSRRYMRTVSHYTYRPMRGETARRFQIVAEPKPADALQISNLQAQPTRGNGRTLQVSFVLSSAATTSLDVQTLSGCVIAQPEVNRTRAAGLHSLTWTAVDAAGRPLPAGVYLLRVVAQDEEGRQVSAARTVEIR